MKQLLLVVFVAMMMMSSSVYAGLDHDQQNWEMDMYSSETVDC